MGISPKYRAGNHTNLDNLGNLLTRVWPVFDVGRLHLNDVKYSSSKQSITSSANASKDSRADVADI